MRLTKHWQHMECIYNLALFHSNQSFGLGFQVNINSSEVIVFSPFLQKHHKRSLMETVLPVGEQSFLNMLQFVSCKMFILMGDYWGMGKKLRRLKLVACHEHFCGGIFGFSLTLQSHTSQLDFILKPDTCDCSFSRLCVHTWGGGGSSWDALQMALLSYSFLITNW